MFNVQCCIFLRWRAEIALRYVAGPCCGLAFRVFPATVVFLSVILTVFFSLSVCIDHESA